MQATIMKVLPDPRKWGDKWPEACSVRVVFDNGDLGEYGTKLDTFQKHREALEDLIGKPSEFGSVTAKEYNGITTHTFKEYPGKPTGGGQGGGGRQFIPAYGQTKEGVAYEQERMDRRTALMQAVAAMGPAVGKEHALHDIMVRADDFYRWLRATDAPNPSPAPVSNTVQKEQAAPRAVDTGHERARPQGSTADSVEEKARIKGMQWIKGFMVHHGLNKDDAELRRALCGTAISRFIDSCKELTSEDWKKVTAFYTGMPTENVLNLTSDIQQKQEVMSYAPEDSEGPPVDDSDPFAYDE